VPYARDAHLSRRLKLAGRRIVEFRGPVEILIPSHASGNKNLAVGQKSRSLSRTRFQHRRGGCDRSDSCSRENCGAKGSSCPSQCKGEENNDKQAGTFHGEPLKYVRLRRTEPVSK
jgi:hypothetical protein